jgi:hypothetical protein
MTKNKKSTTWLSPLVDAIFHHLWVARIGVYWHKCCAVENQAKIDPMHTTFYAPKKPLKRLWPNGLKSPTHM